MPRKFEVLATIKLGGKLQYLRRQLVQQLDPTVVQRIVQAWTKIYAQFSLKRFKAASRGDGTWRPLAPATIEAKGSTLILRDTDVMFKALDPELIDVFDSEVKGARFQALVRFGENVSYPSGVTVHELITFHSRGMGHLPQRKVLDDPDKVTTTEMRDVAKKIMVEAINGS
jgi:hypothetical protein